MRIDARMSGAAIPLGGGIVLSARHLFAADYVQEIATDGRLCRAAVLADGGAARSVDDWVIVETGADLQAASIDFAGEVLAGEAAYVVGHAGCESLAVTVTESPTSNNPLPGEIYARIDDPSRSVAGYSGGALVVHRRGKPVIVGMLQRRADLHIDGELAGSYLVAIRPRGLRL